MELAEDPFLTETQVRAIVREELLVWWKCANLPTFAFLEARLECIDNDHLKRSDPMKRTDLLR